MHAVMNTRPATPSIPCLAFFPRRARGCVLVAITGMVVLGVIAPRANAQTLFGSGSHLPLPSTIGVPQPGVAPVISNLIHPTGFDGTWSAGVRPVWHGTFSAAGSVPDNTNSGTITYDFSGLLLGELPPGTFFNFGDLDNGSLTGEKFSLQAIRMGAPVGSNWLNRPSYVWGTGSGVSGDPVLADMPGWSWHPALDLYRFDGTTVPGNPTISFTLTSNTWFDTLVVTKSSIFNGFSITAPPVPTPGALALLGLGGLVAGRRRGGHGNALMQERTNAAE